MRTRLSDLPQLYVLFDHIVPANNSTTATLQHELREFACGSFLHFSDIGGGICHQLMSEGVVLPGEVVVGADSHSCTPGAFGAFATGVGATDMAAIWLTGETWFRVPDSIAIHLSGSLRGGAEAKDLALSYVSRLGMDGGTYCALEFVGDGVKTLQMDDRLTLCNLSVETGAKTGMFYADDVTVRYLAAAGQKAGPQVPEPCTYSRELEFDLADIVPLVAVSNRVDTVKPVQDLAGLSLDQVFIGTCTNGRYSDLARLAKIVKGRKVAVRTIVVPASRAILAEAIRTGVLADIVEAGLHDRYTGLRPLSWRSYGRAWRGGGLSLDRKPEFQEPHGCWRGDLPLLGCDSSRKCPDRGNHGTGGDLKCRAPVMRSVSGRISIPTWLLPGGISGPRTTASGSLMSLRISTPLLPGG